jgi:hypothetical protein
VAPAKAETAPVAGEPAVPPAAESRPSFRHKQKVLFHVPADVLVEWDGEAVSPLRPFSALPGPHEVVLKKAGFQPIHQRIEVKPHEPTVIQVN